MLKQVQHDIIHNTLCPRLPDGFPLNVNRSPSVILNLFQDLTASRYVTMDNPHRGQMLRLSYSPSLIENIFYYLN